MPNRLHWFEFAQWCIALTATVLAATPSYAQSVEKNTEAKNSQAPSVERGRYVAKIAGCNDCHTAGYAPSGCKVPEA